MYNISIKIENYKCFETKSGFDRIDRVNLIIGRNNSGKSALLDVIESIISRDYQFDQETWRSNTKPAIVLKTLLCEEVLDRVFSVVSSGGLIGGGHNAYGKNYIGREISWYKYGLRKTTFISCDDEGITPKLDQLEKYVQELPAAIPVPLEGKVFKRVLAERDIIPEMANNTISIMPNGNGVTNAIQCFINQARLPRELVENDILNSLNEVFAHDAVFTDIVCQQLENGSWEIYLEEEHKGYVALSKSGSGLKTVITVLVSIILIPVLEELDLEKYIFGFEELENNIHPALLRRLNNYIYISSVESGFVYFLTTHSNVLIDQFSKQGDAQIIHVTQSDSVTTCHTVRTYIENNGVLDDLDVRASDLLQANGIVWVEGPSDRVYLNRWIDLWSDGELKEGTHYQIIFYGGRLLSHLDATEPEDVESGISIFNTNRNAIILIDSDKKNQPAPINATKKRIQQEFENMRSMCWVTKGREIENYIPAVVVDELLGVGDSNQVELYDSFFDHIDTLQEGSGKKYEGKKYVLAEKLTQIMGKNNLSPILDLDEKMKRVCDEIRAWNS